MNNTPRRILVEFIEEQTWTVEVQHNRILAIINLRKARAEARHFRSLEMTQPCEVRL